MILDIKKYKLDSIELSLREMKLLLLLSDNMFHSTNECLEYCDIFTSASITKIRDRVNKKFGKNIITNKYRYGYKTNVQIKINY